MSDAIKTLYIDEQLHRRVKLAATMHGMTIRAYVEQVLENGVAAEGLRLVDTRETYTTKEENDA
jgi:plasmid stability protein